MEHRKYDRLDVTVAGTEAALGAAVAEAFAQAVAQALKARDSISVILATGNSQLSFIRAAT